MERICPICNANIVPKRCMYCPECARNLKNQRHRDWYNKTQKKEKNTAICVVCGKLFSCPPSRQDRLKTCSPECSAVNRQTHHEQGAYETVEEKRLTGLHNSPKTGHYKTNVNATNWTIQSPTGEVYEFRNLRLWCDENSHLYDGTPDQAYRGLTIVKACVSGRRTKNVIRSWKGWKVLRWEDGNRAQ